MMNRRGALALLAAGPLAAQATAFVPADFAAPREHWGPKKVYVLKPLGPKYVKHDYAAYMSSIEHLQKTFSFSTQWPREGITMDEAMKDVEGEWASFEARRKFTYAVLNPAETEEWGCVYISPSPKAAFDAQVRIWVTKQQFDAGLEKTLWPDVKAWLAAQWPFAKVAYVGQDIGREQYRALPNRTKN
jgi:hypothetical protein